MSDFSRFMKANKKIRDNGFYAPTESLCDEYGEPLPFEFRPLSPKEVDQIRDDCTVDVPVTGKRGMTRPKLLVGKYQNRVIVKACVYPDLYNPELQDSYNVKTPEELLYAMVDDAGEYQNLVEWLFEYQGLLKVFDEKVEAAKN